jgi:hypothetical protein
MWEEELDCMAAVGVSEGQGFEKWKEYEGKNGGKERNERKGKGFLMEM